MRGLVEMCLYDHAQAAVIRLVPAGCQEQNQLDLHNKYGRIEITAALQHRQSACNLASHPRHCEGYLHYPAEWVVKRLQGHAGWISVLTPGRMYMS